LVLLRLVTDKHTDTRWQQTYSVARAKITFEG